MKRVLLALCALAAVLAVLLLLHSGQLKSTDTTVGTGTKEVYLLRLEVEGSGRLLVNGSSQSIVNSTRPFTALVEAAPDPCYVLRRLLVNGTPVEASSLALSVGGNTTVKAVFERPIHTLLIVANAANASALVNGVLHTLPAELSFHQCSVVNVTPIAPRGYKPLNGSLLVNVSESKSVYLAFEKVAALVKLSNILAPVWVNATWVNGTFTPARTLYWGDALLEVLLNVTLYIEPFTDQKGCAEYNDTHLACVTGWRVKLHGWTLDNATQFDYPSRVIPMPIMGDAELIQLHTFTKRQFPVKRAEVLTPEGPVEVRMIPMDRWAVLPLSGDYEYLGDGWIKLEGGKIGIAIILEMPEGWKRVRIQVKHVKPGDYPESYVELVVRNTVDYLSFGFAVPPCCGQVGEGWATFVMDIGALEAFGEPGYDPMPLTGNWDRRIKEYFIREGYGCSPNVPRYYCVTGYTQTGPSGKLLDGVKEGWLRIECRGTLYVKVEVIEWRK
ncbi:MAG: hypothetical protein QXX25_04225 [Thermofilaceae archaeon]